MLLKYSISNAKKFFKNTLQNFKSFLSGGYQRLPKTPPFNPFSCGGLGDSKMHHSFRELDNFYTDFTNKWDFDDEKAKKRSRKKKAAAEKEIKKGSKEREDICNGSFLKFAKQSPLLERIREEEEEEEIMLKKKERSAREESSSGSCSSKKVVVREERNYNMVKQRIKEMEMVDVCNVDHVLDIEEVLHYYSRLTCPAYLDLVDRYFMQIYSEFFFATQSAAGNYNSSQRF